MIVDDATRNKWSFFAKSKREMGEIVQRFICNNAHKNNIKHLRCDNAGENHVQIHLCGVKSFPATQLDCNTSLCFLTATLRYLLPCYHSNLYWL